MSNNHNRSELRFLIFLALFLGAVIWFLPSGNQKLSQEECDQLFKLGEEKYRKDFQFQGSWDFANPVCNSHETAILNALSFLDRTVVILPSNEIAFDFYTWAKIINPVFKKREILAFSGIANFEENSVDISTLKLKEGDPVSIANILVHELRHLEEGFNSHIPCIKEPKTTCDMRLEENLFKGGAYNYNVAYLYRLIEFGAITRSQKFSAQTLLSLILENQINAISADLREKYEEAL